jgi:nitrite reductase/ring-hydroxylating ferredoxin subunit/uncharacterized membrane protein
VTESPLLYAGNRWDRSLERLGDDAALDPATRIVERAAKLLPDGGALKDLLSGTWLGHALHPMLTDLPIGFWTSAMALDFCGEKYDDAARMMIGLGIVSSIPTALAGASDWNDTVGSPRRVGAVHALANSSAVALYIGSWAARRRGRRVAGIGLGLAGATMATVGGFLGGHLMGALGVGVDTTAFQDEPTDWTPCCNLSDLSEQPTRVEIKPGTAVLVTRRGEEVTAVNATCPHRGAPLDEGQVDGDIVTCPWHGSRFSLVDGSLRGGPSPTPLRCYEVRVRESVVEVRSA